MTQPVTGAGSGSTDAFPPHVLREYAFVGDGERGALIGPRGDVAWMCAPAWHDDAVFAALLGGSGVFAVTPAERFVWGGHYEQRSLIWRSRWVTNTGTVESRDALATPARPDRAVILRRVSASDGDARLRVLLDVRAGFGHEPMRLEHDRDGLWSGRSGTLRIRFRSGPGARLNDDGSLELDLVLGRGERRDLVLELSRSAFNDDPPEPDATWRATESYWADRVPVLADKAVGSRDAEQSLAVLAGMTASTGAMVAAATMSLPERAREGRNYDYRYAWIRDQCFAGRAAASVGHLPLLGDAVGFVSERLGADGPSLKPAYRVDGGPVPTESAKRNLPGYPGGGNRVGNWVTEQFQLDAFGEALELFAAAADLDALDVGRWDAVEIAVDAIEKRAGDADAGIWEIDDEHWAHSRLSCVSGLRAVARHAPPTQSGRWSALADSILADVSADSLDSSGRWKRSPSDPRIDAALLIPLVRGVLPPTDPRVLATIKAVESDLVEEEFVYRFRQGAGPLGDYEGAFLLCGFVLALAKLQTGDVLAARALFERSRSACGTTGLFSEEFDVAQRQMRGNLPQAFVHALYLETSAALAARPGAAGE